MVKARNESEIIDLVQNGSYERKRIFSIVAHIDHGKTTMSDYLLKAAGLMRAEDAGNRQAMDSDQEEQDRGITIFTSVVLLSFVDERKEGADPYMFQINDTPGHLSFTGEVSRALRSSDGAIILVDALEGIMTQTETNIKLSLGNEMNKPVVFINKVDRLINELRLEPAEVFAQIDKIILGVNARIKSMQPPGMKWQVSFAKGNVAIGSAKDGWAFSMETLKRHKIKPQFVFEKYAEGDVDFLRNNLKLEESILYMIIDHLPDPATAAKYRLPKLASNVPVESDLYKSLINSDPNGKLFGMISKVFIDPKSFRPTLIGRVFSGTLRQGDTIYLVNQKKSQKIKRLGIMLITDLLDLDAVPAGNLFAVFGFICPSGESFILKSDLPYFEEQEFVPSLESIKYSCEAVVSRSIAPKNPQDIGKLGEVTAKWLMADNTAKFTLNKESREYVLSGIDPLQIEILTKRINKQVAINVGEPIIVYREMVTKKSEQVHTKSPNGHNKFKLFIEPLDVITTKMSLDGDLPETMDKKTRAITLREKCGWDKKEARKVWDIFEGCALVDGSKGLQRLDRIQSYVIGAFRDWVSNGPLSKEPVMGVKATFTDAKVHEDPAHTGYGAIAPMTLSALSLSFLDAGPAMFEPIQIVNIKTPTGTEGSVLKVITQHRGKIGDLTPEGDYMGVKGELPAAELMGIADEFRGATQGKAFFGYDFKGFEKVPKSLQDELILDIRKRKKMPNKLPSPEPWKKFLYIKQG